MTLYDDLILEPDATQDAIRAAYRALVLIHHPDRKGDPEKFRRIQYAYDTLGDRIRRRGYDEGLRANNPSGLTRTGKPNRPASLVTPAGYHKVCPQCGQLTPPKMSPQDKMLNDLKGRGLTNARAPQSPSMSKSIRSDAEN